MERVVLHVEVDDALPDAVVLIAVLHDWLKEVSLEVKDLGCTERGKSETNRNETVTKVSIFATS